MKVHTIIASILLILGCAGILYAQDDADDEQFNRSSPNQSIDLSGAIRELQENFDKLQSEVGQLKERVEGLERSNSTGDNSSIESVPSEVRQLRERVERLERSNSTGDNGRIESASTHISSKKSKSSQEFDIRIVLLVVMLIIMMILVAIIIMILGKHKEEKTPWIKSKFSSEIKPPQELSSPSRTQTAPAASSHSAHVSPPSAPVQPPSRPTNISPTQASPVKHPDDNISTLFQSKELRDKRRSSGFADVYVDLNAEIATRITQGEKIAPVFEKDGNYISAPYILIQGKDLYPNFYRFNEGRLIPKDKESTLQQIYDIEGSLPGLVDKCIPAQLIPQANQYTIQKKGSMVIKTPVQM
jgi:hypothetical protein